MRLFKSLSQKSFWGAWRSRNVDCFVLVGKLGLLAVVILLFSCAKEEITKKPEPRKKIPSEQIVQIEQEVDPYTLFKQATSAYAIGEYGHAYLLLNKYLFGYPHHPFYSDARALMDDVEKRYGTSKFRIGVILPMSGSGAKFGEAVLQGITCAAGWFVPCEYPSDRFQLIIKDSASSQEELRRSLQELANVEKITFLLGPLLSSNAKELIPMAEELGLPTITFAPSVGLADKKSFVFQHTLLAHQEMKRLVDYVEEKRLERILILSPKNRYGKHYSMLFKKYLEKKGWPIPQEILYDKKEVNFSNVLRGIKMADQSHVRLYEARPESIDAIFIPDSYQRANQVAQAAKIVEMGNVVLLGTSRWHHPNLLAEEPESLEGVIFLSAFHPKSENPETKKFAENFEKAFGHAPGWLEAFGYDAMKMMMQAILVEANDYGPDIIRSLKKMQPHRGAIGEIRWSRSGLSKWAMKLLTVHDGNIVPVAEQVSTF